MKIVIVSPHRDDAAFSLSLAIDAWLEQGHHVAVLCCFTRSIYAPFWDGIIKSPTARIDAVSALRAHEDTIWAASFPHGGLSLIDLKLEDAPLRLGCSESEVCDFQGGDPKNAELAIQTAVALLETDALAIPLAIGGHVDHVTARDASFHAAMKTNVPIAFYEDLPYAARPGAAKEIESFAAALNLNVKSGFVATPRREVDAFERKLRLALSYNSQIEESVAHDIANFSARYDGRERLWMSPAWQQSCLSYLDSEGIARPA